MTDIAVDQFSYQVPDRSWLLYEAEGSYQPTPTTTGAIDFSKFTAGTHYPNGYIASGTVLGIVTATGKLAPYASGASDGSQTAVGLLYNPITVPTDLTRKVQVTYVDCFAVVSISRLPANSGYATAVATALPLVKFRA